MLAAGREHVAADAMTVALSQPCVSGDLAGPPRSG